MGCCQVSQAANDAGTQAAGRLYQLESSCDGDGEQGPEYPNARRADAVALLCQAFVSQVRGVRAKMVSGRSRAGERGQRQSAHGVATRTGVEYRSRSTVRWAPGGSEGHRVEPTSAWADREWRGHSGSLHQVLEHIDRCRSAERGHGIASVQSSLVEERQRDCEHTWYVKASDAHFPLIAQQSMLYAH